VLEDRRLAVLRAIVEDFVATREPVGSKALVERHHLGVSPATIRNDMAALEDEGYIAQPHTSAGRVPTDKGYRLFVDRLSEVKPMSTAERRAIQRFLDESVDLDDAMSRTVRLLTQLTRQVALVQYPSLSRSGVRHVELVALSTTRLLLVLIADTGRVEQRVIDLPAVLDEDTLALLRARLNAAVDGHRFVEVAEQVDCLPQSFDEGQRANVATVCATLLDLAVERDEERVVLGGAANLTRYGDNFSLGIQPVLEALEEQVILLRLLGEAAAPEATTVVIGHENPVEGLASASVVTAGYGSAGQAVARLGVLGPTHIDYPGTMAAVAAVARYLGRILREQQ
jgi:heat-inducible transcriptional repressor